MRYNISTLYRWIKREKEHGESGLSDKSKRPIRLANSKITTEIENVILDMRKSKGGERIANYLLRKKIRISVMTAWCVWHKHQVKAIVKHRKKSVEHLTPIQPNVSEKFWKSKEEILPRNYEYLKFIKRRNKKTTAQ